jgi:glycosyltransferase involved in cell wall biosynthesis
MLLIFVREVLFDLWDTRFIDRQIKQFKPDVIYLGHITILTRALMPYLSACSNPIISDEGGSGLIDSWEERGIWYKFIEEYKSHIFLINALKPIIVSFICALSAQRIKPQWSWPGKMRIIFNSELNYQNAITKGVPVKGAIMIHSGIDTKKFNFSRRPCLGSPLLIIVPGRIEPRKGQIDAVRLLANLGESGTDAKIIFVGENWVTSYCQVVKNEIKALSNEDKVEFLPMAEHEKLVDLYHQSDICFFPSYFKTGLSRIPLEAMASGCIVISYGNEGSDEVICDKQTGFLVSPADYSGIIHIINGLVSNPEKVKAIIQSARKRIEENNSMGRYVDRIEEIIKTIPGIQ